MGRFTWTASLCALVLVSARVTLAAPTEEASLNNCQNAVKGATAAFIKNTVAAVGGCLQAVSTQIVKKNTADARNAAASCVAQFRRLNDSRGKGTQLSDKLAAAIVAKCDPNYQTPSGSHPNTHTLADILGGAGAGVPHPLDAQDLNAWCNNYTAVGSINTLQNWIDCITAAAECNADSAIAAQYPAVLDWLNLVKPSMAALTAPATDPNKITDAVTALAAVTAAIDGPNPDNVVSIQCPGCTGNQGPCGGSCTDLQTDPTHCGTCSQACPAPANGTAGCTAGTCTLAGCNAGFANCDMQAANGCEINVTNNVSNCGSCGTICSAANGTAGCTNSQCTVASCNPGFANCDMQAANGCEVNTNTSVTNCGSCGNACSTANGTPSCNGGACQIACNAGFANCDMNATNGCETPLNTVTNCGSCGHQCTTTNGTPTCNPITLTCAVASCNAGFANCPGNGTNCATNIATDNNNCGSCGNACLTACGGSPDHVTSTTCSSSTCQVVACAAGYFDLDGACADGCECQGGTASTVCASATSLGTVVHGGGQAVYTSVLYPATAQWYSVTFGATGTPSVILSTNPGSEFSATVYSNCNGNVATPVAGGSYWIQVVRSSGPVNCNSYTLTVSE